MCLSVVRLVVNRGLKGGDGAAAISLGLKTLAEIVLGQGVVWTKFRGPAEKMGGLTRATLLEQNDSKIELDLHPRRIPPGRLVQSLLGGSITLLLDEGAPEAEPGRGRLRIPADKLLQNGDGLGRSLLLKQPAGQGQLRLLTDPKLV
jgi:hypothetical protein